MRIQFRWSRVFLLAAGAMALLASPDSAGADDEKAAVSKSKPSPVGSEGPHGILTLPEAVALALARSPELAAFSWDVRAAEAREIQARLRPNPELSLEMEDVRLGRGPGTKTTGGTSGYSYGAIAPEAGIPGDAVAGAEAALDLLSSVSESLVSESAHESEEGAASGFSEAQFTLSLSQVVELGGKRSKRMQLAARGRDTATWDYEVARADVLKRVAQTFVEVLVAQERVALDSELVRLADQVLGAVSARVEAGRVSPLEATKAQTALSSARVQSERSVRELEAARTRLAALWGAKSPAFERVEGRLDAVNPVPDLDVLTERVQRNPDLARWHAEIERREVAIRLERAAVVPDVTVSAGFRMRGMPERDSSGFALGTDGVSISQGHTRPDRDWESSLVLGVSVPLPLFNRNQGSMKEAEHLAAKASEERRAADVKAYAGLREAYQAISAAYAAITALRDDILPAATQTFESVNQAYREGKFGYLDVLDAQRTLFEARQQYLDALAAYHENIAEIERMIGGSVWDTDEPRPHPEEGK